MIAEQRLENGEVRAHRFLMSGLHFRLPHRLPSRASTICLRRSCVFEVVM
jgi:hypothetical protein